MTCNGVDAMTAGNLRGQAACPPLAAKGMDWANMSLPAAQTHTLNSSLFDEFRTVSPVPNVAPTPWVALTDDVPFPL